MLRGAAFACAAFVPALCILLVIGHLPSPVEAQSQIQFGVSTPLAPTKSLLGVLGPQVVYPISIAFAQVNDKKYGLGRGGCLANSNISLVFENNNGNVTLLLNQTTQLVSNPNIIGLFSGSANFDDCKPFIGTDGLGPYLRSPFNPQIINVRTSPQDDATAVVNFLVSKLRLSRIAIVYQEDFFFGPPSAIATEQLLNDIGLSPVIVHSVPFYFGLDPPKSWFEAAPLVAQARPEAVVFYAHAPFCSLFARIVANNTLMPNATFVLASQAALYLRYNDYPYSLVANGYRIYVTHYTPPLSATTSTLIQQYLEGINDYIATGKIYVPEAGPFYPENFFGTYYYLVGRFVGEVLETISSPVTPQKFIDAVFNNPMFSVAGERMGPFSKECYPANDGGLATVADDNGFNPLFNCCNQGLRRILLMRLTLEGEFVLLPNDTFSWDYGCTALPESVAAPIVFGQSIDFQDPIAQARRQGIIAAFEERNALNGGFNGRKLYLVSFDDGGDSELLYNNTQTLIESNKVMGLISYSSFEDVVAAMSAAPNTTLMVGMASGATALLRSPFSARFLNVRASYSDELSGILREVNRRDFGTRLALVYEAGVPGSEIRSSLDAAVDSALFAADRFSVVGRREFSANSDGEGEARAAALQAASDDNADVILLFTESTPIAASAISGLRAANLHTPVFLFSAVDPDVLSTQLATAGVASDDVRTYVATSVPNPYDTSNALVAAYQNALGRNFAPSVASLEGYLAARFVISVMDRINGDITGQRVVDAAYEVAVFNVDGLQLGPLSDACTAAGSSLKCCGQALRGTWVVDLADIAAVANWREFEFAGCNVDYSPPSENEASSNGGLSEAEVTVIVVVTTVVGGLLVAGAAVLLVLYRRAAAQRLVGRRRVVKEPNYAALALSAANEPLSKQRVAMLVMEVLPIADHARQKEVLEEFEQWVLGDAVAKGTATGDTLDNLAYVLLALRRTDVELGEVAMAATYIAHHFERANPLLSSLLAFEVHSAATAPPPAAGPVTVTLGSTVLDGPAAQVIGALRQESVLSKVFRTYTTLVGLPFLWRAFAELMADIEDASKAATTGSGRATTGAVGAAGLTGITLEAGADDADASMSTLGGSSTGASGTGGAARFVNTLSLKLAAQKLFLAIDDTKMLFPPQLRKFLSELRTQLVTVLSAPGSMSGALTVDTGPEPGTEKFEGSRSNLANSFSFSGPIADAVRPALAMFVFLRYVCPAVTSPHRHGLFTDPPNTKAQRFLVLLSRAFQNLSQGHLFTAEEVLRPLNDFITENQTRVRDMLDEFSLSAAKSQATAAAATGWNEVEISSSLKNRALSLLLYAVVSRREQVLETLREETSKTIAVKVDIPGLETVLKNALQF